MIGVDVGLHHHDAKANMNDVRRAAIDNNRCPEHPDVSLIVGAVWVLGMNVGGGTERECPRCKAKYEAEAAERRDKASAAVPRKLGRVPSLQQFKDGAMSMSGKLSGKLKNALGGGARASNDPKKQARPTHRVQQRHGDRNAGWWQDVNGRSRKDKPDGELPNGTVVVASRCADKDMSYITWDHGRGYVVYANLQPLHASHGQGRGRVGKDDRVDKVHITRQGKHADHI